MPGKFNYEHRHKYPHLIGEDTEVWNRFISKYPYKFDTVDYDIKVGKGIETDIVIENEYKDQFRNLTRKRIDVVGYRNDIITIVEVKKRSTLFTLGQILGYHFLFLKENPELQFVDSLIVCGKIDPDDVAVLNHYAIDFLVV